MYPFWTTAVLDPTQLTSKSFIVPPASLAEVPLRGERGDHDCDPHLW